MKPIDYVNTLQGTDSCYEYSYGNCLPLIARPWGMTNWTPQTDESNWIFTYNAKRLQGIRATHQPSPWMGDYGNFTIMPQTGRLIIGAKSRESAYKKEESFFSPYYFKTFLIRYQTHLEMTSTDRCAWLQVKFPLKQNSRIILQPFAGESQIIIKPEQKLVTGFTRANSGGIPNNFACYFAVLINQPVKNYGVFNNNHETINKCKNKAGNRIGAFIEFKDSSQVVDVKIGTSFVSIEQALENIKQEFSNKPFNAIKNESKKVWNQLLSRIEISGEETQKQTFYSCLYRALLFPHKFYEYRKGEKIHYSPYDGNIHKGILYTNNGFWDTYRTVYPFYSIIFPDYLKEILAGWVQVYRESGWFPTWPSPGHRACMTGTHIDAVMADAYVKGILDNFDINEIYNGLLKHAINKGCPHNTYGRIGIQYFNKSGYVPADKIPYSAAQTQDYAYDNFCIAQIAKGLKKEKDYDFLIKSSLNYQKLFDAKTGFIRGKNSDGSWRKPFNEFEWGGPYIEGSAWQWSWAVPHDPMGLIKIMGGKKACINKLDKLLKTPPFFTADNYNEEIHEMTEMALADFGQYAHSNQPSHNILFFYAYAGQPWKTQYWTRRVLTEMYGPGPDGFPGDEDNGEMSCWYLFNAMGLFPFCPGHPSYILNSPLFSKIILHLPGGKVVKIISKNNSPKNLYVKKVLLNKKEYSNTHITHQELVNNAELTFEMTDTPIKKLS